MTDTTTTASPADTDVPGIGFVVDGPVTLNAEAGPQPWRHRLACTACGQSAGPWLVWALRGHTGATCPCGTDTGLGATTAELCRVAGQLTDAPPRWMLSTLRAAFVDGTLPAQ